MKKKHLKRIAKVLDCKVKDLKLKKRKASDYRGLPSLDAGWAETRIWDESGAPVILWFDEVPPHLHGKD